MNRTRMILIGLIAIALAGALTFFTFQKVRKSIPAAKGGQTTRVAVAAVKLQVGSKITEPDVKLVEMPTAALPSGHFKTTAELVGRGVIEPITENEIVLDKSLAPERAGAGLATVIPPHMRAVSVKVNEVISVAGFVVPGTRVDVLLTGNPLQGSDKANVMTTTVLENITVLASGQKMERDEQGKPQGVTVITLLVSPEDAQKLVLASSEGKIQLALRHPFDVDEAKPPIVKNLALYRMPVPEMKARPAMRKSAPAPRAPEVFMVEMIKGDKREVAKF